MHRLSILPFLLSFLLLTTLLYGQQASRENNILQELNSTVPGKGRVTVYEDERIRGVVGRPVAAPRPVYTSADGSMQYHKMRGYKIQAFSGNDQRTSRNEATHKQRLIEGAFPGHEAVVLFDSPFWRLRVGNFERRDEAEEVMEEIRKAFPSFGREMYIVVDEVKIPIHRSSENGMD
ncbi:MAG: SPOR domain-containing protein [Proteiniphilum sp.]|nr:SPOR domain-containing protein [Proteiniphilum sp.]MDD4459074.1 SPOR domain-containing protein [Proteiniphilum sp.]